MPWTDKEKQRAYAREYYQKNKMKILSRTRKYKEEHIEEYREQSRRYNQKYRASRAEYRKEWVKKNPDKRREYDQRYAERFPEKIRAKSRAWYVKNDSSPRRQEQKQRARLKKFGLTLEAYERLWERQGKCCALCGADKPLHPEHSRLHVDHDHITGAVRGILCHHCNNLLGNAKDNVSTLKRAVDYLQAGNDFRDTDARKSCDRHKLREVLPANNSSGYIGVTLLPSCRWQATAKINGKSVYLGVFSTREEAAQARTNALMKGGVTNSVARSNSDSNGSTTTN